MNIPLVKIRQTLGPVFLTVEPAINAVTQLLAGDDIATETPIDKYAEITSFGDRRKFLDVIADDEDRVEIVRSEICTLEALPELIVKYKAMRDALNGVSGIEVMTMIETIDDDADGTEETIAITVSFQKGALAGLSGDGRILGLTMEFPTSPEF